MKKYLILIAALCTVAAGCQKQEFNQLSAKSEYTTLTISTPDVTKTGIGEAGNRKVTWSTGDCLAWNGISSQAIASDYVGTKYARFIWEGTMTYPAKLLYPASFYKNETTVTLPALQDSMYGADNIATNTLPMCAYVAQGPAEGEEAAEVQIKHLGAVVRLQLNYNNHEGRIAYVEFRGNNGEQLSGDFAINYETATLSGASTEDADKKVRTYLKKVLSENNTSLIANVVIPAGTYSNGFTIKVVDSDGHFMEKVKESSVELAAGSVVSFPAFDFVPTGTTMDVVIGSASDLVSFATKWNNGEFDYEPIVILDTDITFNEETSAAFNATNGIGTTGTDDNTNYFNGSFLGNNHKISGLQATCGIFAYTGGNAIIKDLTIDSSCTFTVPDDYQNYFGPLVNRAKGTISNVKVDANVNVGVVDAVSSDSHIGGVIGRIYDCDVDGCSYTGTISFPAVKSGSEKVVSIGGIGGSIDGVSTVKDCTMSGRISTMNDEEFAGPTSVNYFNVGGIAGTVKGSTIEKCTVAEGCIIDLHGTYKNRIGGIVGLVNTGASVKDCENNASLSFKSSGARAATTPTQLGGISGLVYGSIDNCTNKGSIYSKCNSTTLCSGGIAGISSDVEASITNCINETSGTINRENDTNANANQTNRYIYMGGCIGHLSSSDKNCKGLTNKAAITSQRIGTATQTTVYMGGIIGGSSQDGLVVDDCHNQGEILLNDPSGTGLTPATANIACTAMGGIVGFCDKTSIEIKNSDCTGGVQCIYGGKNTDARSSFVGGIIGYADFTEVSSTETRVAVNIHDCTASGGVNNFNYNTKNSPVHGGLAGKLIGTAQNTIVISSCNLSGKGNTYAKGAINNYRGNAGGIAGEVEYATISGCNLNEKYLIGNANAMYSACLVYSLKNSTITDCTYSNAGVATVKNTAGLVNNIDANSSISDCKLENVTIAAATNAAVLATEAASGATFTNIGIKGTVAGSAITLSSTMITTDKGAVVSGTYLLP